MVDYHRNPNAHKHDDEAAETKRQAAGVDPISFLHWQAELEQSSGVAPEGAEGLDGAGPEDVLVVEGRDGGADQGADPEDPLKLIAHPLLC
jgi:hypothetical protein